MIASLVFGFGFLDLVIFGIAANLIAGSRRSSSAGSTTASARSR
nr:hypothetical protein [Microbacterium sp. NIBRBAC000506063]